ncbi:MAG: glucose-1-phosphate adenylyltransferase [Chlamydiae bacterium]|nr:glucose-1-phosphate adenylyltransferase [Chlamydiota bacterium]
MNTKKEENIVSRVATIVLAGGQGTRLYPLTSFRCKPSVSFGGRYRLIDIPLSNSLNAKINQIFVISQYFASELHQHILATYHLDIFRRGGIELLTPQETPKGKSWFKGTADAIRQNLDYLLRFPIEYFLILSGDQLYNMNLVQMVEFAKQKNADLTIAALPVEREEAMRMGVLKVNHEFDVQSFFEKPQEEKLLKQFQLPIEFLKRNHFPNEKEEKWLGSMGIYIFKRKALISILKGEGDDFGRHLIPNFIKKWKSAAFVYDGYWEDIGTIASYYEANLILTEKGKGLNTYDLQNPIYSAVQHVPSALIQGTKIENSLISQGSIIEAREISHSVIGVRAIIKKNTVIRDSIILGNKSYDLESDEMQETDKYSIGENCLIEKCIIDEHTKIGNHVNLVNKDKLQTMDGKGIFIRDGIIIVTQGTEIKDHFTL